MSDPLPLPPDTCSWPSQEEVEAFWLEIEILGNCFPESFDGPQ